MEQYNLLPEPEKQERRIANHAVESERRKEMEARVAVLEIKVSTAESRIDEGHNNQVRLIDKFDAHVLASTERDHELQMAVGQITVAVTNLTDNVVKTNQSLTTIAEMATESRNQIFKWDAIISTLFKVASILTLVVGAAYSLFTFLESKAHENIPFNDIPAHISKELAK